MQERMYICKTDKCVMSRILPYHLKCFKKQRHDDLIFFFNPVNRILIIKCIWVIVGNVEGAKCRVFIFVNESNIYIDICFTYFTNR